MTADEFIFFCLGVSLGILAEYLILRKIHQDVKEMADVAHGALERAEKETREAMELVTNAKLVNKETRIALMELNTIFGKMKSRAKTKH